MRRRNALANIYEGNEGALERVREYYVSLSLQKMQEITTVLDDVPARRIDRSEIVHSARFRQRRNAMSPCGDESKVIDVSSIRQFLPNIDDFCTSSVAAATPSF